MISQWAKLSNGLSSKEWRNYKRTRQGALAILILYIYYRLLVCATTISIWPLSPCCYLMSITHPPCFYLNVKIVESGLCSFLFSLFYFYFYFFFYSLFLFLEQLRLGVISHAVTSVTTWWRSHKTDHGT